MAKKDIDINERIIKKILDLQKQVDESQKEIIQIKKVLNIA